MNKFFSEELSVVTPEECAARWSGGAPGKFFRCGFCGYKFTVGDMKRVLYTNDLRNGWGNPIVCEKCNDSTEHLRDKWVHRHLEFNSEKNWWFINAYRTY